jgi:hypothetical protein
LFDAGLRNYIQPVTRLKMVITLLNPETKVIMFVASPPRLGKKHSPELHQTLSLGALPEYRLCSKDAGKPRNTSKLYKQYA